MAKKKPKKLPQTVYASVEFFTNGGAQKRCSQEARYVEPETSDRDASGRLIGVYELKRTYVASVRVDREDETEVG